MGNLACCLKKAEWIESDFIFVELSPGSQKSVFGPSNPTPKCYRSWFRLNFVAKRRVLKKKFLKIVFVSNYLRFLR
jgi:hypothetical protein